MTPAKVEKVAYDNAGEVGHIDEPEKSDRHVCEKSSVVTVRPKIKRILKTAMKAFEIKSSFDNQNCKPNSNSGDGEVMVNSESSPKKIK